MAAVAATANVWTWIAHCMRLASEYDERAKREPDPEIRADLLNTVVQFIALADRATAEPAESDSIDEGDCLPRVFQFRTQRPRPPSITRAAAPVLSLRKHRNDAGNPGIMRVRKISIPAPHPGRGILSRCPA